MEASDSGEKQIVATDHEGGVASADETPTATQQLVAASDASTQAKTGIAAQKTSKSKASGKLKKTKVTHSKLFSSFEERIPSLDKLVVVITGTTSGTGKIAASTALKHGATVAMLNRNEEKAKDAFAKLFEEHPEVVERAHFIKCDLQSFESVRNAAAELTQLFANGIDVLCNNAGVMALADEATKDGYDIQMQTNHLSHFLLTKELFPLLTKKANEVGEARIVNHSSIARWVPGALKAKYFGKNGGNLGGNGTGQLFGGRWKRYHQTKLANSVFTVELQDRLTKAQSKVSVYCAHPGIAQTELFVTAEKDGGVSSSGKALNLLMQTQEDGTMGILKCMFSPNLQKGALYGPVMFAGKPGKRSHGPFTTGTAREILWRESEKAYGEFNVAAAADI